MPQDSVIYSHGVLTHSICNRLICFPGVRRPDRPTELVSGKPILVPSCSKPVMYLGVYITEHSGSRGSKSSDVVTVQDIYLDVNMRDGYTLEYSITNAETKSMTQIQPRSE